MSDLRKAAEMALDYIRREGWTNPQGKEVWIALRQALAQPEQEPVAGMFEEKLPDQNPPPWMRHKTGGPDDTKWEAYIKAPSVSSNEDWISLYTAPPKREWVGLTKEEFEQAVDGLEDLEDCWTQIEAKLKEKNSV